MLALKPHQNSKPKGCQKERTTDTCWSEVCFLFTENWWLEVWTIRNFLLDRSIFRVTIFLVLGRCIMFGIDFDTGSINGHLHLAHCPLGGGASQCSGGCEDWDLTAGIQMFRKNCEPTSGFWVAFVFVFLRSGGEKVYIVILRGAVHRRRTSL